MAERSDRKVGPDNSERVKPTDFFESLRTAKTEARASDLLFAHLDSHRAYVDNGGDGVFWVVDLDSVSIERFNADTEELPWWDGVSMNLAVGGKMISDVQLTMSRSNRRTFVMLIARGTTQCTIATDPGNEGFLQMDFIEEQVARLEKARVEASN